MEKQEKKEEEKTNNIKVLLLFMSPTITAKE